MVPAARLVQEHSPFGRASIENASNMDRVSGNFTTSSVGSRKWAGKDSPSASCREKSGCHWAGDDVAAGPPSQRGRRRPGPPGRKGPGPGGMRLGPPARGAGHAARAAPVAWPAGRCRAKRLARPPVGPAPIFRGTRSRRPYLDESVKARFSARNLGVRIPAAIGGEKLSQVKISGQTAGANLQRAHVHISMFHP